MAKRKSIQNQSVSPVGAEERIRLAAEMLARIAMRIAERGRSVSGDVSVVEEIAA